MSDRIRECQEADVAFLEAALEYHDDFSDDADNKLRRAALAFAWKCELAHVGNDVEKIDEWHEAFPLDKEE